MIKKIKLWWKNRGRKSEPTEVDPNSFTREQLENAYNVGYNDGKRDGLTIARVQATKSLKEILWQQNQQKPK